MKRDIFARFGGNPTGQKAAFTRVDLAVVLATLTVIAVMLLPALAATQDRSNRALCQYRLRQVGVVATLYAADNGDNVMTARAGNSEHNIPERYECFEIWPKDERLQ